MNLNTSGRGLSIHTNFSNLNQGGGYVAEDDPNNMQHSNSYKTHHVRVDVLNVL